MNDPDHRHTSDRFDDDAIFADIVAHLNDDAGEVDRTARPPTDEVTTDRAMSERESANSGPATTGPAESEVEAADGDEAEGEETGKEETSGGEATLETANRQDLPTPQVWRAHEVDNEYEEHFEPLPVSPLPVGDLQFWGIIAGMVGGPLLLLYLVFFNRDANSYWILAAIAISMGGFVMLVSRLPRQDEDDDGARL